MTWLEGLSTPEEIDAVRLHNEEYMSKKNWQERYEECPYCEENGLPYKMLKSKISKSCKNCMILYRFKGEKRRELWRK